MRQQAECIQTRETEGGQRINRPLLLLEEVKQLEGLGILGLCLNSVDPEDVESSRECAGVCFNFSFDSGIDGDPASKRGGVFGEILRKLRQGIQRTGGFRNELNCAIR